MQDSFALWLTLGIVAVYLGGKYFIALLGGGGAGAFVAALLGALLGSGRDRR